MRKLLKLLSILMLILSSFMVKGHFVVAETGYTSITIKVPVSVHGVEGDVVVSNWGSDLKDKRYDPYNGPLPNPVYKHIGADKKVNLEFTFTEFGNYVYRVEEPVTSEYNTDDEVNYDKRVYRLYISIIDDGSGQKKYFGAIEAEDCGINGASCKYDDTYDAPPYEGGHTPSPVPVVTPTPTPSPTPSPTPVPKVDEMHFNNIQSFWVRYTNGEESYYYYNPTSGTYGPDDETNKHGTSSEYNDGDPCEVKRPYDSYPYTTNTVTPNSGWEFTGKYKYIITRDLVDENGYKILDSNGKPIQVIIPEEEYVFNGLFFNSLDEAKAAVDRYNASKADDEEAKTYGDIMHVFNTPMGETDDPLSIQIKGNVTFIPIYRPRKTPPPTSPGWWVPYTGDNTNLVLYGGLFGGSILIILLLLLYLRKKKK